MSKKLIEVVGAAILSDNKVLAMQRSEKMTLSGMWEFPGGKIEAGESEEEALIREIKEELDVEIEVTGYINEAHYAYDFGEVALKVYTANILQGEVKLKEHSAQKWVDSEEITQLKWAPVDIPAVKELENLLTR